MNENLKIAAVFASYNRKDVALRCVDALRKQTRPLDLVVVCDNASQDGSYDVLKKINWHVLHVIQAGENTGNAGAVMRAMEYAFTCGMDAVWILDDDSLPRPDALEKMLEHEWNENIVLHPLQEDPKSKIFTWPLKVRNPDGTYFLAKNYDELPSGKLIPSAGVWTGALITRKVRKLIGAVKGELFIRGEDEEYPWRMELHGVKEFAVRDSVMDHPGPDNLIKISLLGKNLFLEKGLSNWKLYYKVRNMIWLQRQKSGFMAALAMTISYTLGVFMIDGVKNVAALAQGIQDGWAGRLGIYVPRI